MRYLYQEMRDIYQEVGNNSCIFPVYKISPGLCTFGVKIITSLARFGSRWAKEPFLQVVGKRVQNY